MVRAELCRGAAPTVSPSAPRYPGCCCWASSRLVQHAGERKQQRSAAVTTSPGGMPSPGEKEKQRNWCLRPRASENRERHAAQHRLRAETEGTSPAAGTSTARSTALPAPSRLRAGSARPLGACLGRRGRQAARSPVIGLAVGPRLPWEAPRAGAEPGCSQRGPAGRGGGELGRARADPSVGHHWGRTAGCSSLICCRGFRRHGKGFSPFVSFCDAQDKCLLCGCTKAHADPPWGVTWAGRGWVHAPQTSCFANTDGYRAVSRGHP